MAALLRATEKIFNRRTDGSLCQFSLSHVTGGSTKKVMENDKVKVMKSMIKH